MCVIIKCFARSLILLLIAISPRAAATSYATPKDQDIYSPDNGFVLHITAKTGLHSVAETKTPTKYLWTFKRRVWHDEYHVASDGNRVAWISWRYAKTNDFDLPAIIIYSKSSIPSQKKSRALHFGKLAAREDIKGRKLGRSVVSGESGENKSSARMSKSPL